MKFEIPYISEVIYVGPADTTEDLEETSSALASTRSPDGIAPGILNGPKHLCLGN